MRRIHTSKEIVKPPALRPGDRVGIVAPASPVEPDLLRNGCAALRAMGYEPFYFESILERDRYFAGSVQRRVRELEEMFARDDVRAIVCARGGYGCNYLLPEINLDLIRSCPKVFVGYSDVTTLLTWFCDAVGLVTFHGPMVTKDFTNHDGVDVPSWRASVGGLPYSGHWSGGNTRSLVRGVAQGKLYGGCLSMLVASLGTPYEINTEGTILFIEDVAARPYQVDRMLMQLKLAGKLDGARGIVFGNMMDCDPVPDSGYTLQDVIARVVGDLGIPIAYGLPFGHVNDANLTIPVGVQGILQVQDEIHFGWEPAVEAQPGSICRNESKSAQ